MDLVVQKFGGSGIQSTDCFKKIAVLIAKEKQKGSSVVVVVSAMAGVTRELITKAKSVSKCNDRSQLAECDVLLSSGEQVSAALLALALQELGLKARSYLSWQLPLKSDSSFGDARLSHVNIKSIRESLEREEIPIIAGFQGIDASGRITTLGLEGSDTTALGVAAALCASRCDLYKNVEGVLTADPGIVNNARKIDVISYKEMLELSSSGARVLHSRAVDIAMRYKVPTRIMSTSQGEVGTTLVDEVEITRESPVTAITYNDHSVMITVSGIPTSKEESILFSLLSERGVSISTIVKNLNQVTFIIKRTEVTLIKEVFENYKDILKYDTFKMNEDVNEVALVGSGIRSYSEVIRHVLEVLAGNNIEILFMSSSELKLTIFTHNENTKRTVQVLHKEFIG